MQKLDDAIRAALTMCWRRRAERIRAEKDAPEASHRGGTITSGAASEEDHRQYGKWVDGRWRRAE